MFSLSNLLYLSIAMCFSKATCLSTCSLLSKAAWFYMYEFIAEARWTCSFLACASAKVTRSSSSALYLIRSTFDFLLRYDCTSASAATKLSNSTDSALFVLVMQPICL